jgi:hypothetical protein
MTLEQDNLVKEDMLQHASEKIASLRTKSAAITKVRFAGHNCCQPNQTTAT